MITELTSLEEQKGIKRRLKGDGSSHKNCRRGMTCFTDVKFPGYQSDFTS